MSRSLWNSLAAWWQGAAPAVRRPARAAYRPVLDRLEDRTVPSHFGSATLNWTVVGGNELRFTGQQVWRRDAFDDQDGNEIDVGDVTNGENFLEFGDGDSEQIFLRILEVNLTQNIFRAEIGTGSTPQTFTAGIEHTYAATGNFTAFFESCCRFSDEEEFPMRNNADGSFRVETLVNVGSTNRPPASNFPPCLAAVDNTLVTFSIATTDPNGHTLRYRFATPAENGGGTVPGNMTINAQTGVVTWDLRDPDFTFPNDRWNVQFMIEDTGGGGQVVYSRVPVDITIFVVQAGDPGCGQVDVTQQVRVFYPVKYAFNRATGLFSGFITLVNRGNTTINGPIAIAFPQLPAGVQLANANGTSNGTPSVAVNRSLLPNQPLRIFVQFRNPLLNPLRAHLSTFQLGFPVRVFSGGGGAGGGNGGGGGGEQ